MILKIRVLSFVIMPTNLHQLSNFVEDFSAFMGWHLEHCFLVYLGEYQYNL